MAFRIAFAGIAAVLVAAVVIQIGFAGSADHGGVTIRASQSRLGRILVDGRGRSLGLFERDRRRKSSCTGACAGTWPPPITSGMPLAGAGAKAALLGRTRRSAGRRQVTCDGHPLHTFVQDARKGQTNGERADAFGANWYLVSLHGATVEDDDAPSNADSSSSYGYGYGYGG